MIKVNSKEELRAIIEASPRDADLGHLDVSSIDVTPGETDGFGWLSGRIHTKKGIIVFG